LRPGCQGAAGKFEIRGRGTRKRSPVRRSPPTQSRHFNQDRGGRVAMPRLVIPPFPRTWAGDLARRLIPWPRHGSRGGLDFARRSFVDTAGVCDRRPGRSGGAHETCDGRDQSIQARPDRERQERRSRPSKRLAHPRRRNRCCGDLSTRTYTSIDRSNT
jgi:hypothetical protein